MNSFNSGIMKEILSDNFLTENFLVSFENPGFFRSVTRIFSLVLQMTPFGTDEGRIRHF